MQGAPSKPLVLPSTTFTESFAAADMSASARMKRRAIDPIRSGDLRETVETACRE